MLHFPQRKKELEDSDKIHAIKTIVYIPKPALIYTGSVFIMQLIKMY